MSGEGRSAIITGASAGIGNHLARSLLHEGWSVYGVSRRMPDIVDPHFVWCECDIANAAAVASMVQRLPSTVDAVVHNAAVSGAVGPGLDTDLAAWRAAFEVNFFAPLNLTKHLVPRCRPNACIVFLSGGGAVTPRPFVGPYALSKLAVVKLAEQLALEYPGVRFYALAPGVHRTELFEEQRRATSAALPPFATFEEVARLLHTLIADVGGRLNGRLVHIRDDLEALLSVADGGLIRRVERR
jgi:NAD(P)-dependent dehydrogenase (short-subunit alcohol dehydrogenase family)